MSPIHVFSRLLTLSAYNGRPVLGTPLRLDYCIRIMSQRVQASWRYIWRCITLFRLMQRNGESWFWLEAKLDEEFPTERPRWPGRLHLPKGKEAGPISRNTIRRWADDPSKALRRPCSGTVVLGLDPMSGWNHGRCIHFGESDAVLRWMRFKETGEIPPLSSRKRLRPGRKEAGY